MKPCKDCEHSMTGGRCATSYVCSKYIEWQVDVAWRQEDDPQEERGLDYQIDDREV